MQQLVKIETPPITIDITDSPSGRKRKAELVMLIENQSEKYVSLVWRIYFVDSEGNEIIEAGTQPYQVERRATNNTIAKVEDGTPIGELNADMSITLVDDSVVYPDENGEYDFGFDIMGQYDWFYMIGENQQINVHTLIRSFGMVADWSKI